MRLSDKIGELELIDLPMLPSLERNSSISECHERGSEAAEEQGELPLDASGRQGAGSHHPRTGLSCAHPSAGLMFACLGQRHCHSSSEGQFWWVEHGRNCFAPRISAHSNAAVLFAICQSSAWALFLQTSWILLIRVTASANAGLFHISDRSTFLLGMKTFVQTRAGSLGRRDYI